MHQYGEVYRRLLNETATLIFIKSNGDVRLMLATRNPKTYTMRYENVRGMIEAYDKRYNIKNGNIAVVDLMLGEARSFNIDRLVNIEFHGEITTEVDMDKACMDFKVFRDEYTKYGQSSLSMELLSD